jgi:hypothetical protein
LNRPQHDWANALDSNHSLVQVVVEIGELVRIEPHLIQNRRVQVFDVNRRTGVRATCPPFDDPNEFDGTPQERSKYDERCQQIARELLFVFSEVRS